MRTKFWFLVLVFGVQYMRTIKLCNNFWSYNWSFLSNECYDDPNSGKNISEVIRSWGFSAEEHYLTTDDGYKLLVERAYDNVTKNTPIILVHGMSSNAIFFVMTHEKSLTQLLGKLGYDVWLLNYRGTKYSRGHVNLTTDQNEYWKFKIDDLGVYDIRTTIRYVSDITKQKPIYLGYSLGTTGFFVYSTTFSEEAQELLKGMIALTPVINWRETRTIARFFYPIWSYMEASLLTFIIHGLDSFGVGIATQYFQIYESGVFQKYDYGPADNLRIYGMEEVPPYNMSKIPVPVAIFLGGTDVISSKTNCDQIYDEIQPSVRCGYREIKPWGHLSFALARNVVEELYLDVIETIEDIEMGKCHP